MSVAIVLGKELGKGEYFSVFKIAGQPALLNI